MKYLVSTTHEVFPMAYTQIFLEDMWNDTTDQSAECLNQALVILSSFVLAPLDQGSPFLLG